LPYSAKRLEIEKIVVGWRGINLEIAGVDDHAERRVNGERDAVN
jgi:hypothetical protein